MPSPCLIEAVGQRGRRRLVDDAQRVQSSDPPRVLGGLPLRVVEVSRHGDDGARHLGAQELRGVTRQLAQHLGAQLFGRIRAPRLRALDLHVAAVTGLDLELHILQISLHLAELAADEALDRREGVFGVDDRLAARNLAHELLAAARESHHRRRCALALSVGDDGGLAALDGRDGAVGGAQVCAAEAKSARLAAGRGSSGTRPRALPMRMLTTHRCPRLCRYPAPRPRRDRQRLRSATSGARRAAAARLGRCRAATPLLAARPRATRDAAAARQQAC